MNPNIKKIYNLRTGSHPDIHKLNENITPDHVKKPFLIPKVVKNTVNRTNIKVDEKRKAIEDSFATNLVNNITSFLKPNTNWYLNFGGTGDLVLLLAGCYNDTNAQVVFCANTCSMDLSKELLEFFKKDYLLSRNVMGSRTANTIYDYMRARPNLKPSAHLSKGLNFGDWPINQEYYKKNITLNTNWINEIGKNSYFNGNRVIVIQPSGSVKTLDRQRYLTQNEYNSLVKRLVNDNYYVITTGSQGDKEYYNWRPWTNKNYFMTSNQLFGMNNVSSIDLKTFLQTINTAEKVISMDTWLKTYTSIAGIETVVIQSRCRGGYLGVGSDVGDSIFLNTKWWPNMRVIKYEDLFLV
jgi:hypothetical protein